MGILTAVISRKTMFHGEAVPFVMELPNYRLPGAKNVLQLMWDKAKDFLQRAFTVIFMASLVIWFLQTFNYHFQIVTDSSESILASIAGIISPLLKPIGLGDWRIVTSLITGFLAKESVVATISMLYGSVQAVVGSFTTVEIISLLVFCLLYTPCVAAVAAIRRELGFRWALCVVFFQCALAWVMAFAVKLIGMLF